MSDSASRRGLIAATAAVALLVPLAAAAPATAAPSDPADKIAKASKRLQKAVTLSGMLRHQRAFQRIAHTNDNTRAAGTPGHAASADYVTRKLREAGYDVTVQQFQFPFFDETAPPAMAQVSPEPKTYATPADFQTMTFSGNGAVQAAVHPVDLALADPAASTSGCEASDFAGFPAGAIALVQRGGTNCTFELKAGNAQAAGATAVIFMNQGNAPDRTGSFSGTLGRPFTIPAVGTSFAVGQDLADPAGTVVRVETHTVTDTRPTTNVIAETDQGRDDNVVMLGAHLDSVTEGPGINDNGSGSSALLELALNMDQIKPKNKIRFAWWSAEEFGLLGSEHYVAQLDQEQQLDIGLYLNFDMIASPNYFRGIYDGDNSDGVGAGPGPVGSAAIEDVFEQHFAGKSLPYEGTDFTGRSDYGPFIAVGIPAGGLFTGAEGIKTAAQAARYGGTAGAPYDACYHEACDDLNNLNTDAFDTNADAIAHATAVFAFDTSAVNGERAQALRARVAQQRAVPGLDGDAAR
jgi:Zn-dependent M28 family amino/carboxypeptidase